MTSRLLVSDFLHYINTKVINVKYLVVRNNDMGISVFTYLGSCFDLYCTFSFFASSSFSVYEEEKLH